MVLFTSDVKKIKGAAHNNGDVDRTCKQVFSTYAVARLKCGNNDSLILILAIGADFLKNPDFFNVKASSHSI